MDLGGDDDDDNDDDAMCPSQGLHGEKANSQIISENEDLKRVERIKRKRASDIQPSTSTCTSSADFFEIDNLPVKRSKFSNQYYMSNFILVLSLKLSACWNCISSYGSHTLYLSE